MPVYILDKIKRTSSGQKTVDSEDIDGKIVLEVSEASEVVTLEGKDAAGNDVTITLGTAAKKTVGTGSGNVATLNSSGDFSTSRIPNLSASKVTSGRFNVDRVAWSGTQAAYDALTPDANTIYLITG